VEGSFTRKRNYRSVGNKRTKRLESTKFKWKPIRKQMPKHWTSV